MLRIAGAELVEVKAQPYKSPNHYVKISGRLAEALGGFWAQQFDNQANRNGHVESTGPEIWAQTDGKVDAFCCSVGTGGTLAGVSLYLRSKKPDIVIGLTDPVGGALVRYFTTGELRGEGSSITEGIGQSRITGNLEGFKPDLAYEIPDSEMLPICYDLLKSEGLALGGSSGINVAGAIRIARELGPGKTIVTVLPDMATKYQNKMFNLAFLRAQHLPTPPWFETGVGSDVQAALNSCVIAE
eukprot:TRINITY_DN22799_c0_g1_i2.p1 TRINITY_DN22799_c0_g1~~TRINITY_DN22799_c0_g1_i2.p1  ORF type:complete len:242 (+),score=44.89 TRINITY_DN22799_c0_g1_i2:515-1240(+)